MSLLLLLDKTDYNMENINIPLVICSTVVGGLVGLYFYGKYLRKNKKLLSDRPSIIKVSGKDPEELEKNMKNKGYKNIVTFEHLNMFTYEDLATWINNSDLGEVSEAEDVYGCLVVRTIDEINKFNIDLSSLSLDDQNHLIGALIVNTNTKEILKQRWIVASDIDEDLSSALGSENSIILK